MNAEQVKDLHVSLVAKVERSTKDYKDARALAHKAGEDLRAAQKELEEIEVLAKFTGVSLEEEGEDVE